MRLSILLSIVACLSFTSGAQGAVNYSDYFKKIDLIDHELQTKGSSLKVLQEYDSVASDLVKLDNDNEKEDEYLRSKISTVFMKKGIINYSLGRDKLSLQDFDLCLQYGDTKSKDMFKSTCFDKFIDISFQFGKTEDIQKKLQQYAQLLSPTKLGELEDKLSYLTTQLGSIETLYNEKSYDECLQKSTELLSIFKSISSVRSIRIKSVLETNTLSFNDKVNLLIEDYTTLTNNNDKSLDLENYVQLFKLQYFIKKPDLLLSSPIKLLHKCLRINNDFKSCQLYSKLSSKLDPIYELYNKVSLYYSFVYFHTEEGGTEGDLERIEELEPTENDWYNIHKLLLEPNSKIKLRKDQISALGIENSYSKYSNNLELLVDVILKNTAVFNFDNSNNQLYKEINFIDELLTMAEESFTQISGKFNPVIPYKTFAKLNAVKVHHKVTKDEYYLFRDIQKIDKLLASKSYEKANDLLQKITKKNFKQTKLYKSRFDIIDREYGSKVREQEQRRRHQQRQQQQRQQQQYYEQFNQQQHQPPRQKAEPANDYYKILGVPKNADEQTIKKAYREKVKQNHPDKLKNSGTSLTDEQIEAKMAEINNAYEVLSDPEAKKNYDHFGEDPNDGHNGNSHRQQQQQQQFHNFNFGGGGGSPFGGQRQGQGHGQRFHFNGGFGGGNPFGFGF